MTVILSGVVGSTAYGLAHEDSDVDRMSVWVGPRQRMLGFGLSPREETRTSRKPDVVEHEVGKFLRLCLKGNPSVIELLWLPGFDVLEPWGQALVANRSLLLSSSTIRQAYGGYVLDQARRLERDLRFPDVPRTRIEKHGRHCVRLLIQAQELLDFERLTVLLTPAQQVTVENAGKQAVADPASFKQGVDQMLKQVDEAAAVSHLPEKPDRDGIEQMLSHLRGAWRA